MTNFGLAIVDSNTKVPLKDIKVKVHIQDFTANVVSTLEYINEEDDAIEAEFIFPMDDDAAVYHFEVEIDDRVIVGECQEKKQANETYEDAINYGYGAFKLQEDTGDIFHMNVGNLPPKKKAIVSYSYVVKLNVEVDAAVCFKLPTILNPRYTPQDVSSSTDTTDKATYCSGADIPYTMEFSATINGSKTVKEVRSEHVPIVWEKKENDLVEVKLKEDFLFNCDIILLVFYDEPHKSTVSVSRGNITKEGLLKQDVLMLNIFPELDTNDSSPNIEFVFVVDRSGSMCGDNIKQAKSTLLLFLKSLPVGCNFNIISFGSEFSVLFKTGSQSYGDCSLKEAMTLQNNMEANMGGTELLKPLTYMYNKMPLMKGFSRQVFILTDGGISNTDTVIDLVRRNSSHSRVFTFGIGHGASTKLVKGIARAGKGKAEFVTGEDRLQAKVVSSLKLSMEPSTTDVKIEWCAPAEVNVINVPTTCPVLFNGDHFVFFGVINGEVKDDKEFKVVLTAKMGSKNLNEEITIKLRDGQCDELYTQHRLAAKDQIKQLEDGELSGNDPDVKNKILLLSTACNIASKYTAFVGVDKETKALKYHTRPVPVQSQQSCSSYACMASQSLSLAGYDCDLYIPTSSNKNCTRPVVDIMRVNVDQVLERDQKLSELDDRAETLQAGASQFEANARKLKRKYWWKNLMSTSAAVSTEMKSSGFSDKVRSVFSSVSNIFHRRDKSTNNTISDYSNDDEGTENGQTVKCNEKEEEKENFSNPHMTANDTNVATDAINCPKMEAGDKSENNQSPKDTQNQEQLFTEYKNVSEKAELLIKLQKFDGSWDLTVQLTQVLNCDVELVKKTTNVSDDSILATVMALNFLEVNCSDKRNEWVIIADKATKWLGTQVLGKSTVELKALVQSACCE